MSAPAFVWTDRVIREALGLRTDQGGEVEYTGVSTDSRTAVEGDLYVALVGDRFDGHDFVADAAAAGAKGAVVSRPVVGAERLQIYPADDTLVALGALAGYRRRSLPARVVAITGSAGKTTTRELTAGALASAGRVHASRGNFNNRVGLPLTLLAAPEDADVVVAELGSSEPGEIALLTDIARPDIGVITTVGESHLEKLGSLAGVMREKLDLLRGLDEGARAVVGDEPSSLPGAAREIVPDCRVAGWSDRADGDLRPGDVEVDHWGYHGFAWHGARVSLGIPGRHVVVDALLALAVADLLDVAAGPAAEGVSAVRASGLRGEVRRVGKLTLLVDCYNANPPSVRAALDLLEAHGHEVRRVAVLGSMLELGERGPALHREVLADALSRELELVVATGAFARAASETSAEERPDVLATEEPRAAYTLLAKRLEGGEVVLLKASRGVSLERLVPLFEEDFGGDDVEDEAG